MAVSKAEQKKFYEAVENLVWQHDIEWMEALLLYIADRGLDPAAVAKLVNKPLKAHLTGEASTRNLLKKGRKK